MKAFKISFQYSENTYCTNIVFAPDLETVETHYRRYKWKHTQEATESDIREATRKGMPIKTVHKIELKLTPGSQYEGYNNYTIDHKDLDFEVNGAKADPEIIAVYVDGEQV